MRRHAGATLYAASLTFVAAFVMAATTPPAQGAQTPGPGTISQRRYVGSATCARCHTDIAQRWSQTRMANVVTDPRERPEVIIPDLATPDPLVTFTVDDIAFVYGSKWKQRYFARRGDDYYPLPAQWDVANHVWRPYFVRPGTDWWEPFYPAQPGDNSTRPTGPLCDGCHSVNYDIATKTVTEWNVGCERCHGPGSEHASRPVAATIINPARLDPVHATDTCIQCHSQGQPLTNPIDGRYYDWPVGFRQGLDLKDFWRLEEHTLGETSFTHYAEGTAHKNRMQGNDFVQSLMYRRGVTCFSCHDVHGTPNNADLIKPVGELCLTCHGTASPNGPHAASIDAHTRHPTGVVQCVDCHMPKIETEIANVNIRSHTFNFVTPDATDQYDVPNPCLACHDDRDTSWVRTQLATWDGMSPWRLH